MKFLRRLWFWLRRRRLESEFEEEVRLHLERKAEANIEAGMAAAGAWRCAHLDFGNAALAKEHSRRSWGFLSFESILQDLRFGIRQLRNSPGFAAAAILTLALGIGANVAIFSTVYAVLLRPLPFKDSDRLLMIRKENQPRDWYRNAFSAPEFLAWRSQATVFDNLAAYEHRSCVVNNGGEVDEYPCETITGNLFSVLGVAPVRGRSFSPDEDDTKGRRSVILSYALWQRRYAGEESAIGRTVQLNGEPATVVGVMPAGFSHGYASPYESMPDLWVSGIALSPALHWNNYFGIGRLKRHATLQQARGEMDGISAQVEQAYPDLKGWRAQLMTLRDYSRDNQPVLVVLMGAVTFVLLIACANVANLLLARGAGRTGEFALRKALGAGQARLVRQVLTESLLISVSGGALGILLAGPGTRSLAALAPASLLKSAPGLAQASADTRVLIFAVSVALATTMLFGVAPALQSTRLGAMQAMKESGPTSTESFYSRRLRSLLVVCEIALAIVLMAGAGLMVRTLRNLSQVQLGFNSANLLTLRVPLAGNRYKDQRAVVDFWHRVTAAIASLPGVESASVSWGLPLDDWNGLNFTTAEQPDPPAGQVPDADYEVVSPEYFHTMQVPLIQGRLFNQHDGQTGEQVTIINAALARRFWPGQDPLGKRLRMEADAPWLSVVGVVGNVLTRGPASDLRPQIYVPVSQLPWVLAPPKRLVVRTGPGVLPESIANPVIEEIHRVDKEQPVADLRTMEQIAGTNRAGQRMLVALLGSFAGLALILSSMGIYGVLSYSVAQRTHEIGVRMALGAQRSDVMHLVMGSGIRLAFLGIASGVAAAILLTRLITDFLYGVRARDPVTFLVACVILACVILAACYIPAHRASRVDPILALRHE